MPYSRPADLFDREWEWDELIRFADDPAPGLRLGLVWGRRRQGKSYLLRRLARGRGLYHQALEGTPGSHLDDLGRGLAEHLQVPAPMRFERWHDALESLVATAGAEHPATVVLDEFPYLASASAELPSLIQRTVDAHEGEGPALRLILCGSALGFMGRLLSTAAPLRGRARLNLAVEPFDFRTAASFWGLEAQPELALRVHSILGGTPAYHREFVSGDAPESLADFDRWVTSTVLNPARPLFREGSQLLAEEPDVRQTGLYHAVLAAIASGHSTRGAIATQLRRVSGELQHPLRVLEETGLIAREEDALRRLRPTWRITDPIVRFNHAVMRPVSGRLDPGADPSPIWRDMQPTYRSLVLGPHLEELAREWVAHRASRDTVGGPVARVAAGTVNDPAERRQHQLDIVALGARTGGRTPLLMIGEAKLELMTPSHLARLRRLRDLIASTGLVDCSSCRLACVSATGFHEELRSAARPDQVVLVDLRRLYAGS